MRFPYPSAPARNIRLDIEGDSTFASIYSVSPASGSVAGGTAVTLKGLNFRKNPDGTTPAVFFGIALATSVVIVDANTITCTTPSNAAGAIDVHLQIGSQISTLTAGYTYNASTITEPVSGLDTSVGGAYTGPANQVTALQINGTNFSGPATVTIGGVAATSVVVVSATEITIDTPALAAGYYTIVVTNADGSVGTLVNGFHATSLTRGEDIRRVPGVSITKQLGQPYTGQIYLDGNSPAPGPNEPIKVIDTFDSNRVLFQGMIQRSEMEYEAHTQQFCWQCDLVDYRFFFNKYYPTGIFVGEAASVAVQLVQKFAPGFTTGHIQNTGINISLNLDGTETMSQVFDEICNQVLGAKWDLFNGQDVGLWTSAFPPVIGGDPALPPTIDDDDQDLIGEDESSQRVSIGFDASQVRNDIIVTGGGSTLLANPNYTSPVYQFINNTWQKEVQAPFYVPYMLAAVNDPTQAFVPADQIAAVPGADIKLFPSDPTPFRTAWDASHQQIQLKVTDPRTGITQFLTLIDGDASANVTAEVLTQNLTLDPSGKTLGESVQQNVVGGAIQVSAPQFYITVGATIQLYLEQKDQASITFLASIEKNADGSPTDGVHQYVANDPSLLTLEALQNYADAQIEVFGKPIITVKYATRNPLHRPGVPVVFDLSDPAIQGTFLIQEVVIDQIHDESDQVGPRFTCTASSMYFTLNQLLAKILAPQQAPAIVTGTSPSAAQSVAQTIAAQVSAPITAGGSGLQQFTYSPTATQINSAHSAPIPLINGQPGQIVMPIFATFEQHSGASWSTSGVYGFRWSSDNITFVPSTTYIQFSWNNSGSYAIFVGSSAIVGFGIGVTFAGKTLYFYASADSSPGGVVNAPSQLNVWYLTFTALA